MLDIVESCLARSRSLTFSVTFQDGFLVGMGNLETIFLHRPGPRSPLRFKFNPCPRLCLADSRPSLFEDATHAHTHARCHVNAYRRVKTVWTFVVTRGKYQTVIPPLLSHIDGSTVLSLSLSLFFLSC